MKKIYAKNKSICMDDGFAKVSKNLAKYRSENNFVEYQNT